MQGPSHTSDEDEVDSAASEDGQGLFKIGKHVALIAGFFHQRMKATQESRCVNKLLGALLDGQPEVFFD
jgi:hypothetical protein